MKTQFKNSLVILMTSVCLSACSSKVSKDIIESYKVENAFFEISLREKAISKEDLLRETEDNYDQLMSEIDSAKRETFSGGTHYFNENLILEKEFRRSLLIEAK